MDTVNQKLPRMAAALVPRELATWSLTAVALGALEGGLLGVIVKNQFAGVATPIVVNFAVAVVAAAPSFSNLASFLFASFAAGRDKLALLGKLMLMMGACLVVMALPGTTAAGLAVFCIAAVLARVAWSGILVVRAAVWRANYVRAWRARVTARIVKLASLLMAAYSALIGVLLDWRPDAFRPAFVIGGASALFGALVVRKSRLRRQRQLIAAELAEQTVQGRRLSLPVLPMLVILLNERLNLDQMDQVMVTSSLPLLVFFFSVSFWARLLDRRHIFSYRAFHSWFFAAASLLFMVAVITAQTALLWPASVILGGAFAGGSLGWNLGHNDFSNDGNASHYMAIHVTLTGLRGLVMPLVGVGFYEYLSVSHPGYASWALLLPFSLTFSGALIFVFLHLQLVRRTRVPANTG